MNQLRHNPWSLFNQLKNEFNYSSDYPENNTENTSHSKQNWSPAADIKEDESKYVLLLDIPGVDTKNIDIQMEKDVLTIKGERDSEKHSEQKDFKHIERQHGEFHRRFSLPEGVNTDAIQAKTDNGVLTINIPKQEIIQSRKINVN